MKPMIAFVVLTALCACLWAEVILYSQNTLFRNSRWMVGKRMAEMDLMGGDATLITRSTLAGNMLHLGSWFGFQEVIFSQKLNPSEIRFRFRLQDRAYVSLIFAKTEAGFTGIRLSRNSEHRSAYFEATREGEFKSLAILRSLEIADGWHEAIIKISGGTLTATNDGVEILRVKATLPATSQIGFSGGVRDADVDDVVIRDSSGAEYTESFRNAQRFLPVAVLNFVTLLGLTAIAICAHWIAARRVDLRAALIMSSVVIGTAILCGGLYFLFDFFYWSHLSVDALSRPIPSERRMRPKYHVESLRHQFTESWYRLGGGTQITTASVIKLGYPANRTWAGPIFCARGSGCQKISDGKLKEVFDQKKTAYRILFVGTSQTVGGGAQKLEETFFVRTHRFLSKQLAPTVELESLNMAVSGSTASRLFKEYQEQVIRFNPDMAVINLSNNDNEDDLERGVSDFLEVNRLRGILTVLLEEAISSEVNPNGLVRKYAILRSLGKRYDVPVLQLHGYLADPDVKDTGLLWWDFVHMTSYGQDRTARWLAPQLLRLIPSPHARLPQYSSGRSLHDQGVD